MAEVEEITAELLDKKYLFTGFGQGNNQWEATNLLRVYQRLLSVHSDALDYDDSTTQVSRHLSHICKCLRLLEIGHLATKPQDLTEKSRALRIISAIDDKISAKYKSHMAARRIRVVMKKEEQKTKIHKSKPRPPVVQEDSSEDDVFPSVPLPKPCESQQKLVPENTKPASKTEKNRSSVSSVPIDTQPRSVTPGKHIIPSGRQLQRTPENTLEKNDTVQSESLPEDHIHPSAAHLDNWVHCKAVPTSSIHIQVKPDMPLTSIPNQLDHECCKADVAPLLASPPHFDCGVHKYNEGNVLPHNLPEEPLDFDSLPIMNPRIDRGVCFEDVKEGSLENSVENRQNVIPTGQQIPRTPKTPGRILELGLEREIPPPKDDTLETVVSNTALPSDSQRRSAEEYHRIHQRGSKKNVENEVSDLCKKLTIKSTVGYAINHSLPADDSLLVDCVFSPPSGYRDKESPLRTSLEGSEENFALRPEYKASSDMKENLLSNAHLSLGNKCVQKTNRLPKNTICKESETLTVALNKGAISMDTHNESVRGTTFIATSNIASAVSLSETTVSVVNGNYSPASSIGKNDSPPSSISRNDSPSSSISKDSPSSSISKNDSLSSSISKNDSLPSSISKNDSPPSSICKNDSPPSVIRNNITQVSGIGNSETPASVISSNESPDSVMSNNENFCTGTFIVSPTSDCNEDKDVCCEADKLEKLLKNKGIESKMHTNILCLEQGVADEPVCFSDENILALCENVKLNCSIKENMSPAKLHGEVSIQNTPFAGDATYIVSREKQLDYGNQKEMCVTFQKDLDGTYIVSEEKIASQHLDAEANIDGEDGRMDASVLEDTIKQQLDYGNHEETHIALQKHLDATYVLSEEKNLSWNLKTETNIDGEDVRMDASVLEDTIKMDDGTFIQDEIQNETLFTSDNDESLKIFPLKQKASVGLEKHIVKNKKDAIECTVIKEPVVYPQASKKTKLGKENCIEHLERECSEIFADLPQLDQNIKLVLKDSNKQAEKAKAVTFKEAPPVDDAEHTGKKIRGKQKKGSSQKIISNDFVEQKEINVDSVKKRLPRRKCNDTKNYDENYFNCDVPDLDDSCVSIEKGAKSKGHAVTKEKRHKLEMDKKSKDESEASQYDDSQMELNIFSKPRRNAAKAKQKTQKVNNRFDSEVKDMENAEIVTECENLDQRRYKNIKRKDAKFKGHSKKSTQENDEIGVENYNAEKSKNSNVEVRNVEFTYSPKKNACDDEIMFMMCDKLKKEKCNSEGGNVKSERHVKKSQVGNVKSKRHVKKSQDDAEMDVENHDSDAEKDNCNKNMKSKDYPRKSNQKNLIVAVEKNDLEEGKFINIDGEAVRFEGCTRKTKENIEIQNENYNGAEEGNDSIERKEIKPRGHLKKNSQNTEVAAEEYETVKEGKHNNVERKDVKPKSHSKKVIQGKPHKEKVLQQSKSKLQTKEGTKKTEMAVEMSDTGSKCEEERRRLEIKGQRKESKKLCADIPQNRTSRNTLNSERIGSGEMDIEKSENAATPVSDVETKGVKPKCRGQKASRKKASSEDMIETKDATMTTEVNVSEGDSKGMEMKDTVVKSKNEKKSYKEPYVRVSRARQCKSRAMTAISDMINDPFA